MNKERAINIAVACVMVSDLDNEEKKEVIDNLRESEEEK